MEGKLSPESDEALECGLWIDKILRADHLCQQPWASASASAR
jgi:hypothetical protein